MGIAQYMGRGALISASMNSRFGNAILALFLAVCCSCLSTRSDAPLPTVRGPLPTRIQQPVSLTRLSFRPRRPVAQQRGSGWYEVQGAYTSIFEVDQLPGERVGLDGEYGRVTARGRWALGEQADLEVEVPVQYATSGFLDSLVNSFHAFFNLPVGGRTKAEDDQYEMRLRRNGQTVWSLDENELALGDVPLVYTRVLRREDEQGPGLAWRIGLELPLGDESVGVGSGGVDGGLGLIGERNLGRWTLSGAVDLLWAATPDSFAGAPTEFGEQLCLQFGSEYRWTDHLSLLGQLVWASSPVTGYELEEIDAEIIDLGLGAAWDLAAGQRLFCSFHEDLVAAAGGDFGIMFGWSCGN